MSATADVFAGLERASLRVTAMRFSGGDETTLARPSQSIKAFRARRRSALEQGPRSVKTAGLKTNRLPSL